MAATSCQKVMAIVKVRPSKRAGRFAARIGMAPSITRQMSASPMPMPRDLAMSSILPREARYREHGERRNQTIAVVTIARFQLRKSSRIKGRFWRAPRDFGKAEAAEDGRETDKALAPLQRLVRFDGASLDRAAPCFLA